MRFLNLEAAHIQAAYLINPLYKESNLGKAKIYKWTRQEKSQ